MDDNWCKQDVSSVLLVEGPNDCHVTLALCKYHNVPESFGIYACGSDEAVLRRLNALVARENPPDIIGIMLDADQNGVLSRWNSIKHKLSNYNYNIPNNPNTDGTIIEPIESLPKIGVWLMPDNVNNGLLEDFCLKMIDTSVLESIDKCIELAETLKCTTFKEDHRPKARTHAYLALQDEPGKPLGQSITAQVLKPTNPLSNLFIAWLNKVFVN